MVDSTTNSLVKCQVTHVNTQAALITGYAVMRFGVSMTGKYVNANGMMRKVTISPAVPGAQYRITAWALTGNDKRSAAPAARNVTTGTASECGITDVYICTYVAPYNFQLCMYTRHFWTLQVIVTIF